MSIPSFLKRIALTTLLLATAIHAARPFATDDAGIVSAGSFELETAADYWSDNATFGFCLKHGITDRMDLGVSAGRVMYPRDERSFSPVELGIKFGLVPDLLSISFAGSFSDASYGVNLIASKEIKALSLHANMGYSAIGATNDADFTWGAASRVNIGRVSPGIELCGTHEVVSWCQAGLQCSICDWCSIDAGIGSDFSDDVNLTATTGLWFTFPINKAQGD